MYYFDFIPNELSEIIISILDYDDFISYSKAFDINNLNFRIIYYYKFNNQKVVDYKTYEQYLGISDVNDKVNN